MKEIFIKKSWDEEGIIYYIHFVDGKAIQQIELQGDNILFLSEENPTQNGSMLFDQDLDILDLDEQDFINKDEFHKIWGMQNPDNRT